MAMNPKLLQSLDDTRSRAIRTRRQMISEIIENGPMTITDLGKNLNLSIPTVTKIVGELIAYNCLKDNGKLETNGGRYPNLYGLIPEAGYFVGVDVKHTVVNIGIVDFVGDTKATYYKIPYVLDNTPEALEELCKIILARIEEAGFKPWDILNINVNVPGRVRPSTGQSYTSFSYLEPYITLSQALSERLGTHVTLDNDTRGMAYGEYTNIYKRQRRDDVKNVLYINLSWGVGMGIIIDGEIYMGRSGFAGEFGHIPVFDNEVLCRCGKKGCLETEVSGQAFERILHKRVRAGEVSILSDRILAGEQVSLEEIIEATKGEDFLCMEILGEMGANLGKQIATLVNLYNPDLVIIGGTLSTMGEYITQAIRASVSKYAPNLVSTDTTIATAIYGDEAGVIGSCMMARSRRFK